MTEQPTLPRFVPVPAFPILVLPAQGVRIVRTTAGMFAGSTFREAIAAAMPASTAKSQTP